MRAVLRALMSLEVHDLSSWAPESDEWAIGIRILAGPDDGPGEESFDFTMCSVEWLATKVRRDGLVDGRHLLVADGFNWEALKSYVERRVRQSEGDSWGEVAERLGRLGHWEFEDYQA